MDYKVADIELAEFGRKEIELAEPILIRPDLSFFKIYSKACLFERPQ